MIILTIRMNFLMGRYMPADTDRKLFFCVSEVVQNWQLSDERGPQNIVHNFIGEISEKYAKMHLLYTGQLVQSPTPFPSPSKKKRSLRINCSSWIGSSP